jgi:multiple sugar transport system permease protein
MASVTTPADTGTEARRKHRSGVSAAAPAARVESSSVRSGRTFTVVSWIVLVLFAVLWIIPSLWAI